MADAATVEKLVVNTGAGALRGRREDGVAVFRGVPYAAPPVGTCGSGSPSRCRPGAVSATRPRDGPVAPQGRSRLAHIMGDFERPQSEDCLTLNIWTPAPDAKKRPVMVWIHGGAFCERGRLARLGIRAKSSPPTATSWRSRSTIGSARSAFSACRA